MILTTTPLPTLDLPNFPWTENDLGDPKFKHGDLVCERFCHPTKKVVFKVTSVMRPNKTKGVYHKGYEYKLSAYFKEDEGEVLHENETPIPECCIMSIEDGKEDIIGSLLSKARDIKELRNKKERY